MRPLNIKKLQRERGMDFVADCVLDLISDFPNLTPTYQIVDECNKDGVASPGPTNRCIVLLKKKGLIAVHKHPTDKDARKRYIQITPAGLAYLKEWES